RLTWDKKTDKKVLYLTFDDGPTPEITIWILKQLSKYNAKATFFCLGKNVVLYPKLLDFIICEGHSVGNHTYNHLNAWKTKKEKYFAWLPAIPYGTVAGTLRYNGETIAVEGTGYHDHNWGNIRLDKIKTQWYWGRAKIGEYTLIFSQMLTSPKYGGTLIPVFYLAKDDIIISDLKFEYEFTASGWRQHPGGRDYPTKIRIVFYQDNLETAITISNPEFIAEKYLLEVAPWFVKVLSKPFTNPYYFRFKSDFELNIKDHGEQINKTGSGIFEMMLLRGLQTVR
ncbi:MAG: polysaccharide deacetylase family protein, partial [Spirochaetales bacterium]|nr:polysaccharide deacetylase family protein [Spirochaetales bacterium]